MRGARALTARTVRQAKAHAEWRELIENHEASGGYFFTPGAMEFFDSQLVGLPVSTPGDDSRVYFLTSEQYHGFTVGDSAPREYRVRLAHRDTNIIDTIGEPYPTAAAALAARNFIAGIK